MKVIITWSAEKGLQEVFDYHREYSVSYAEKFYDEIIAFIMKNLSNFPKIGHIYNKDSSLYRIIFLAQYNIYYKIQGETVFILYILDSKMGQNSELKNI